MGFSRAPAYTGPAIVDPNTPPPGYRQDPSIAAPPGSWIPLPIGNEAGISYQGGKGFNQIGGTEYQDISNPQFAHLKQFVKDPSLIGDGRTPSSNINYPADTSSFWSEIAPFVAVAGAPLAAMFGGPALASMGLGGGETSAGMMASQEAGFGAADLAGWGGATTAGEAAGGAGSLWGAATDYAKSNPFGAIKKVYGGLSTIGSLMGGNSGNQSGGTGGNMGNSIGDWASALSPFLSALNTNNQAGNTSDTYGKAYDLITTPSPDQQNYRTQLSQLMSNPGSMESSHVYKAMAEAGMNNVNRTAAAKGMLGSGNRLAELMKVGQDTASRYYFPQQQALAGLSGIQNDSAQRTLGADSLISGQGAQNRMQTSMLSDLMGGFGASPEQQFINQLLGDPGVVGTSVGNMEKVISDWFNGQNAGNYSEGSSVMPYIDPWATDASTIASGTDWSQYLNTPDYTQSNFTVDPSWFA